MIGESNVLVKQRQSSLPLQALIYFNYLFVIFFFSVNICLFTYKAIRYYYPSDYLGWDIVTIFLYAIVDSARLMLASRGNKTSTSGPFWAAVIFSLPLFALHAYYIALQTYVLRVDVVINAIAFFFLGAEMFFSVVMIISLYFASKRI